MLSIIGDTPEKERIYNLFPNMDGWIRGTKYEVIFVCLNATSLSKTESATELFHQIEGLQSDIIVFMGVVPVGTMDILQSKLEKPLLNMLFTENSYSSTKTILLGGDSNIAGTFTKYFSISTVFKTSFEQVELSLLSKNLKLYSQLSTGNLLNKLDSQNNGNVLPAKLDDFEQEHTHHNSPQIDNYHSSIQHLEVFYQGKGIRTYLLNAFRREYSLNLRQQDNYQLPYPSDSLGFIYFHDVDQPFGFLSNFSEHPIYFEGVIWKTVEHFYQAQKFKDIELKNKIRLSPSPVSAKEVAWDNISYVKPHWDQEKESVMLSGLQAKFAQHPELMDSLISTGSKLIVEYSEKDKFWGDCGDGSGQNILGSLLMKIRTALFENLEQKKCVD